MPNQTAPVYDAPAPQATAHRLPHSAGAVLSPAQLTAGLPNELLVPCLPAPWSACTAGHEKSSDSTPKPQPLRPAPTPAQSAARRRPPRRGTPRRRSLHAEERGRGNDEGAWREAMQQLHSRGRGAARASHHRTYTGSTSQRCRCRAAGANARPVPGRAAWQQQGPALTQVDLFERSSGAGSLGRGWDEHAPGERERHAQHSGGTRAPQVAACDHSASRPSHALPLAAPAHRVRLWCPRSGAPANPARCWPQPQQHLT